MSNTNYISFYKKYYPYKDIDPSNNTGYYYISKKDINPNHQYSIHFSEYVQIMNKYFDLAKQILSSGKTLEFPNDLGFVSFHKFPAQKRNIDFHATKRVREKDPNAKIVYSRKQYKWGVNGFWNHTNKFIKNKYYYKFTFVRQFLSEIQNRVHGDPFYAAKIKNRK